MYNSDESGISARKQIDGFDLKSLLLDSVTDSIFVHDFEEKLIYVNEAAYIDRGYTREELMKLNLQEIDIPEYALTINTRIKKLKEKNKIAFESSHRCKDGSIMYVENHSRLIKYGDQQLILAVVRDINEKKSAEKKLKESEERYKKLVELNPVTIAVHSGGKIVYCDVVALKLLGAASKEAIVGKPLLDFIHPDHGEIVVKRITKSQEEQRYGESTEEKFLRLDGRAIDVEVTSIPTMYEGEPATQMVVRDITEKKMYEEALIKSEKKYRDLVENINEVFFTVDKEGTVTYVSPAVETLSGYNPANVMGKPFIDFIHPEDIEKVKKGFENSIANRNYRSEFRVLTKSGGFVWVSSYGRVRKEGKKDVGVQGVLIDITRRKRAEEKLKESEKRYRTTFEHTGTAMIIIEEDTTVSLVNEVNGKKDSLPVIEGTVYEDNGTMTGVVSMGSFNVKISQNMD